MSWTDRPLHRAGALLVCGALSASSCGITTDDAESAAVAVAATEPTAEPVAEAAAPATASPPTAVPESSFVASDAEAAEGAPTTGAVANSEPAAPLEPAEPETATEPTPVETDPTPTPAPPPPTATTVPPAPTVTPVPPPPTATPAPPPTATPQPAVTIPLPAVDVVNLHTGGTENLASYSTGGPLLLWFWAPH